MAEPTIICPKCKNLLALKALEQEFSGQVKEAQRADLKPLFTLRRKLA